ncbi:MAG: hypothetical protein V5A66_04880 [Candidatus Thermoplasmatota archaeon]
MGDNEGNVSGMAIAVLGILMIIGLMVIKFFGPRPFVGIENPEGKYGMYFWSGMVIGIIVLIIGGAMSMRKEEETSEEEEMFDEDEEIFTTEEEEEEMTMEEEYGKDEEDIFEEDEEIE